MTFNFHEAIIQIKAKVPRKINKLIQQKKSELDLISSLPSKRIEFSSEVRNSWAVMTVNDGWLYF